MVLVKIAREQGRSRNGDFRGVILPRKDMDNNSKLSFQREAQREELSALQRPSARRDERTTFLHAARPEEWQNRGVPDRSPAYGAGPGT